MSELNNNIKSGLRGTTSLFFDLYSFIYPLLLAAVHNQAIVCKKQSNNMVLDFI